MITNASFLFYGENRSCYIADDIPAVPCGLWRLRPTYHPACLAGRQVYFERTFSLFQSWNYGQTERHSLAKFPPRHWRLRRLGNLLLAKSQNRLIA